MSIYKLMRVTIESNLRLEVILGRRGGKESFKKIRLKRLPVLVYKSMIRSAVEYGIEVWSDLPHYLNEKMENVRNRAL